MITSEQVGEFMLAKTAELRSKTKGYISLGVEVSQLGDFESSLRFTAYQERLTTFQSTVSIDDAIEQLTHTTLQSEADILRAKAAALISQAEALEAKG